MKNWQVVWCEDGEDELHYSVIFDCEADAMAFRVALTKGNDISGIKVLENTIDASGDIINVDSD